MSGSVYAFRDLPAELWDSAGGKGGTLARLTQAGYPVPDGFLILPAAFEGDALSSQAWTRVAAQREELRRRDAHLDLAVRSSALAEDSARASFAGEFETVLGVRDDDEFREAIAAVRASRHSERVLAYSRAQGLVGSHEMAVIVQRLVPAEYSGVLFTADPITGSRNRMLGNYVQGQGDKLVSGKVEPLGFALARPRGGYEGPAEMKRSARQLFKLASRLERELGGPLDIEWAVARGKVHLLQARPITTLQGFDSRTGESNDSLTGDFVWSSVNIGEAMSIVMTPFTWSAVRTAYNELNIVPGYAAAGNIGGRAYQNVTVMASMFRALGRSVEDLSQEMGGVREEYLDTMDRYIIPVPEATFLNVLPNALGMLWKQRKGSRNLEPFAAGMPAWCTRTRHRIEGIGTPEALLPVYEEIRSVLIQWFWHTMATAWLYGERVGRIRRELREMAGAADADILLSNVSSEDELLASLGPVVGLARVVRGEMSREAYLEQWGHRGALETEASAPRPAEDPSWLDEQLRVFAQAPIDVDARLSARRAAFDAAWRRFEAKHPRKAPRLGRRLADAAEVIRVREAIRSEGARLVWVARDWARRAGKLTGLGDGVFFLTVEEVADLLSGKDAPVEAIPARQETYERYKALPRYPLLIRGRFDPFEWAADPDRRDDVYDSHGLLQTLTLEAPGEGVVLGMPGSAGRVEGVVRRLDSPGEGEALQQGEILVTSQTNIGWTLLFPRVGAVVTDIGAPLSHAAIVARELGIPAVVNCGDATARLRTGDRVLVDGTQGTVEILEE